ncbi:MULTISPECIES: YlmH/Sll1252 family protein [Terrabacteria group]|uniref:YlmH/Sll1252 family protein n=1 Tax=Bacillati TaxID=1783272 RepID=UPI0021085CA4|nr:MULTISPECIES: YlmH/Sll1252 family protein [Terrabacteria group]MBW9212131.1 hypothetical protein [Trueperella sp. zg.1013]
MKTRDFDTLVAHLRDLQLKSELWNTCICSNFLEEAEQTKLLPLFPESSCLYYFGGYKGAMKKKVIFSPMGEDGFSDIVCLKAKIDQRFRKIGHKDVLGALMSLQVERSSFGDFWIENDAIYLYTSEDMVSFFEQHLTQVNQLRIHWERLTDYPVYERAFREFEVIVASYRIDAMVSALMKTSREKAKHQIQAGQVSVNHEMIEDAGKLCHNGTTISIRGCGRFQFIEMIRQAKSGRLVAHMKQYI